MTTLDLVEEFQSLDEMEDDIDAEVGPQGLFSGERSSDGLERSIGGADLSGILALDDEEDYFVELATDAARESAGATSPDSTLRPSASFLNEAGRNLALGDRLALEQRAAESESWNSDDDQGEGGANVPTATAGDRRDIIGGKGLGGFVLEGALSNRASGAAIGVASSSKGDHCSNPNVSSPTRPAEEDSDWDGASSQSSNYLDGGADRMPLSSSSREILWSPPALAIARGDADTSYRASPSTTPARFPTFSMNEMQSPVLETEGENRSAVAGGRQADNAPFQEIVVATEGLGTAEAGTNGRSNFPPKKGKPHTSSSRRPAEHLSRISGSPLAVISGKAKTAACGDGRDENRGSDGEAQKQGTSPVEQGSPVERATVGTPSAEAAAATIETLQAELRRLREHVLRSEQRREAQLYELSSRLEEQERRSTPTTGRKTSGHAVPRPLIGEEGRLVLDGAGEAGRAFRDTDSSGTPQGAAVHNPFAATTGGAATPRDHFPAFEDALHDADGGDALGRGVGEEREEAEADKSLLQSEAFDFSIDTLSHINNHTDFGTDAPIVELPAAAATVSPKVDAGRKAGSNLDKQQRRWSLADPASRTAVDGVEQEEEDAAAEEAFFADACATATLQTPVKHVLAAASSGAGVAVRRVRLDGRPARGTPAERSGPEGSAQAIGRPLQHVIGEQSHQGLAGRCAAQPPRDRVGAKSRPCGRESSVGGQKELCMADFFARASAELEDSVVDSDGIGGCLSAKREVAVARWNGAGDRPSPLGKTRSGGVDAATQTTWSFPSHEEVYFVSAPLRTAQSTPMVGGKDSERGEGCAGWKAEYRSDENADNSSSGAFGAPAYVRDEDLRGTGVVSYSSSPAKNDPESCRTPRDSRPPRWQAPRGFSQGNRGETLPECVGAMSDASAFSSLNLSPIADARTRPASAPIGREGEESGGGRGDAPSVTGVARTSGKRQRSQGFGNGLSPILSDGSGSASTLGGEALVAFAPRAGGELAGCATVLNEVASNSRAGQSKRAGRFGGADLDLGGNGSCSEGTQSSRAPADRAPEKGARILDSSFDITRSSLLRASTTLESIAPLDDSTVLSLSFQSRAGGSVPGELFADVGLSPSDEPSCRFGACPPQRRHVRHGTGLTFPPPLVQQGPQQRRSASAPTLPSEPASDYVFRPERSTEGMARTPSLGVAGVPPAVVGAWLAAAIEGMYGHNSAGGGDSTDERSRERGDFPRGGRDGMGRSPLTDLRTRTANATTLLRRARAVGAPAYAAGGADSPPPPPPPPSVHLGADIGDGDDAANEEDIFYQRQRLLQRAVSAAASHGGVVPPSARGTAAAAASNANVSDGAIYRKTEREATGTAKDTRSRRHSDPLSWETPPTSAVATAAATSEEAGSRGSVEGVAGWSAGGTSAYQRRHTSGYWRDRLGMTQ